VSRELVLLYWSIGRDILARQGTEGWGTRVIDRLSHDLQNEFPGVEGFSSRRLKYMRSFAEAWPEQQIVQQVAALLPWGHQTPVELLDSLLFVVGVMLEQLIVRATARVLALASVTITLSLEGGASYATTQKVCLSCR
jgi:DUF1016 N-terminal domain